MIVTIDPLFNDVSSKQTSIMAKTMILHVAGTIYEYDSCFFSMKTKMKKHDEGSNDKDDCVLKRCFQIKMEYPLSCTII